MNAAKFPNIDINSSVCSIGLKVVLQLYCWGFIDICDIGIVYRINLYGNDIQYRLI